ncbi:uncharacterized protein LOC127082320 [Lathyrus oleraceus]|uniref:uncharacterized protein LOC127082320 n=1 Tax=Pisum sativum TaxID=3888 RepID=UPI0021CFE6D1|nr:uncharacterized protein LOC127082320 [Pisum sativum]
MPSTKKGLQSLLGKINFLRRFISNLSGKTQAFSPLLRLDEEVFEWGQAQQEAFDKIKAYLSHPPILTPTCRNKSMRLYISASDKTLGSMLAQEDDNGVERAIYYLSRVLNDAKTSRIGKWALALTEFSLTYMPLKAVKGQVVADFIVDHSIDTNALNYVELGPWKLYFDRSSHKVEGICSNNEVEYEALIAGLEISNCIRVQHFKGKVAQSHRSQRKGGGTRLIPSNLEKNKLGCADEGNFEILAVDSLTDEDWRKPIVVYLQNPTASTDRKTRYRALSYVLLDSEFFKKSPEGILLKCLNESEAYFALLTMHNGACGAHQVDHNMKWLLFHQGVYWPTMLKDCVEFTKGCQECQVHAGIQHVPASELHSIIKPWPFRGWALYLIGEIRPPSSKSQRYILVGVDYFTKWIEVIPLPNVNQEDLIEFIQKHIMYRFRIPKTITTDQGYVFTGRKMQEFTKEMGFNY